MQTIPGCIVAVDKLPHCNFCGQEAKYDFVTTLGPWANGCRPCYLTNRFYRDLGVGKAQRLLKREVVR